MSVQFSQFPVRVRELDLLELPVASQNLVLLLDNKNKSLQGFFCYPVSSHAHFRESFPFSPRFSCSMHNPMNKQSKNYFRKLLTLPKYFFFFKMKYSDDLEVYGVLMSTPYINHASTIHSITTRTY